ncbi:MAG: ABC transporter ATP-binding protein [Acidobacteriota bacterium]|nr:ABC transporter ATP-binding protein [Acidobacteriota bacterium]
MKSIIKVENVSKRYCVGKVRRDGHATLRDKLAQSVRAPTEWLRRRSTRGEGSHINDDTVWALKDVSFEVAPGEVVGIIGRNGAGKSTLLKVLSRITTPTAGRVELRGRVGSLLEVGVGFHAELTGRENVYMNGAILGMRRGEIKRKFDEIVYFADIEKFLETPVKHYSSGMYMRLAFAVAAHLEPDILIVDEVLAVGDAAFQQKCLGKMNDVARAGRTVLFVSHNMAAVAHLCRRGIVLGGGEVQYTGTQTGAITEYLAGFNTRNQLLRERTDRVGTGDVKIVAVEIKDENGRSLDVVASGRNIKVYFHYEARAGFNSLGVIAGLIVTTQFDVPVFLQHNRLSGDEFGLLPAAGAFVCHLPRLPLPPATYRLGCSVMYGGEYLDMLTDASQFTVVDGDFYGTGEVPPATHGCCLVEARWQLETTDRAEDRTEAVRAYEPHFRQAADGSAA